MKVNNLTLDGLGLFLPLIFGLMAVAAMGNKDASVTSAGVNGEEDAEDLLVKIQDFYASYGITTVQDGGTSGAGLKAMRHAGKNGRLKLDIVTYPSPLPQMCPEGVDNVMAENQDIVGQYVDHVKIGGYKILLDGSPQGKTAWMREPYENSGDYCGYPWLLRMSSIVLV